MNVVLVDNYDSFTFNLYQLLGELGAEVTVRRNDEVDSAGIARLRPTHIVLSPGPGRPDRPRDFGVCADAIVEHGPRVPLLGVCLGHQCVGYSYGARVDRASEIKHGKSSLIYHDGKGLFIGLPNPFPAIRYHSLAVVGDDLPDCLEVSAWTSNGIIMGLRHCQFPVDGVQFHPESIMTEVGKDLLRNFINREDSDD